MPSRHWLEQMGAGLPTYPIDNCSLQGQPVLFPCCPFPSLLLLLLLLLLLTFDLAIWQLNPFQFLTATSEQWQWPWTRLPGTRPSPIFLEQGPPARCWPFFMRSAWCQPQELADSRQTRSHWALFNCSWQRLLSFGTISTIHWSLEALNDAQMLGRRWRKRSDRDTKRFLSIAYW